MPMSKMDPSRADAQNTAYIYQTVIAEPQRGNKLVAAVVTLLFKELDKRGFTTAERDSRVWNGYADKVSKEFEGTFLEEPYDHNPFGIGDERHFKIDVKKYLDKVSA